MAELWRSDLVPYRTILARVPLVLIGHSAYKSFDYNLPRPASLSDGVVEGLLRTKLAYRGVAMADDLNVEAIRRTSDLAEAAVRSIVAGCDLVRIGGGAKPVEEALSGLQKGLESGRLTIGRVEQSLARLSHVKKELAPPPGRISHRAFLQLARKFEDFSRQYHPPEQKIA
jgi:beta-N-acetylhexosaminidase